jgi:hypothetical protein
MIQAVLGDRYRLGERIADGGMGVEALVVIGLVLLAWLPRGGRPDPPSGLSERPLPAGSTTVPGDD